MENKKSLYKIQKGIIVPDGTKVFPIVDPGLQRLSNTKITEELSFAYGEIDPGVKSNIHVHPICTQITFVLSGELEVCMKDKDCEDMYSLNLKDSESILTNPGSFFQLINNGQEVCKLLYQCAPGFVLELDGDGNSVYNDAVVLPYSWNELKEMSWNIPELEDIEDIRKSRFEAIKRLNRVLDL